MATNKPDKNWVKTVQTDTVSVPKKIMVHDDPEVIAKALLKANRFPGAHGSINKFIQYHINRGGKGLSPETVTRLKKAQEIIRSKAPKK
jgi:uncharacterized protein YfdQ (DUF2303 family)